MDVANGEAHPHIITLVVSAMCVMAVRAWVVVPPIVVEMMSAVCVVAVMMVFEVVVRGRFAVEVLSDRFAFDFFRPFGESIKSTAPFVVLSLARSFFPVAAVGKVDRASFVSVGVVDARMSRSDHLSGAA